MFTGLVEAVGTVEAAHEQGDGRRFRIAAPGVAPELHIGDSVAVDGVCLTAVRVGGAAFEVDAIGTTLSRTTLGGWREGRPVNLERALRMGDRLGGHLVQGHVDGVGELLSARAEEGQRLLDVRLPADVLAATILHGSITLDGVSLTVNALLSGGCQVAIIPHTWASTNLSRLTPGDALNVEGDLVGKYVQRLAEGWIRPPAAG